MAFKLTTSKELKKHTPFDVSIVTDTLNDGEFFADDKSISPSTKIYIVKIPKASQTRLATALKRRGYDFSKDKVDIPTGYNKCSIRLQKTGKTALSSDAKTTEMQENASLIIIRDALQNNKRYTDVKALMKAPVFKDIVTAYPDINDTWCKGLLAQANKMRSQFSGVRFDTYNRDGGFMKYISDHVSKRYGISKKDSWNPADIWLIKNERQVRKELDATSSLRELNDVMRSMYRDRRLCGISLKAVSGSSARFEEVNMSGELLDPNAYKLSAIKIKFNLNSNDQLDSTDAVISVSGKVNSKFQIRQNSKGFNNLKFEPTQQGAGAARLGKVPLDMLRSLLKDFGVTTFNNNWRLYPQTAVEFEKQMNQYQKMFDDVYSEIDSNVPSKKFFSANVLRSFSTNDAPFGYTTSKLMQLSFIHSVLALSKTERNKLFTQMLYLAKKEGPIFGPFGKLY